MCEKRKKKTSMMMEGERKYRREVGLKESLILKRVKLKKLKNEWMEKTENRQERCVWEGKRLKEILTEDEKHQKVNGVF